MRTFTLLILLCLCVFTSCHSQKQKKIPDYIEYNDTSISIKSAVIEQGKSFTYVLDSTVYDLKGILKKDKLIFNYKDSLLLIATSKSTFAFLINMNEHQIISRYILRDTLTPNQYVTVTNPACNCPINVEKDLQSIDFYKNGDIIIQTEPIIKIINQSGIAKDSFILNNPASKSNFLYSNVHEVPVSFNEENNSISVFKYCYKCYSRTFDYYSHPIQSQISIDKKEIKDHNILYPEIYRLFYMGFMETVHRRRYKNEHFFTFAPDHRIYVYNILTDQVKMYDGCSKYANNRIRVFSKVENKNSNLLLNELTRIEMYYGTVFDPKTNRYYRLFSKPRQFVEGITKVHFDYYVQMFDHDFSLVSEIKVPKINPNNYFPYNGKLYWISIKQDKVVLYNYSFVEQH